MLDGGMPATSNDLCAAPWLTADRPTPRACLNLKPTRSRVTLVIASPGRMGTELERGIAMLVRLSQAMLSRTPCAAGQALLLSRLGVPLSRLGRWLFYGRCEGSSAEQQPPREKLCEKESAFLSGVIKTRTRCLLASRSSPRKRWRSSWVQAARGRAYCQAVS